MKRKWVLIFFCGLMVLSAILSALLRRETGDAPWSCVNISERGFSPRQLPTTGSNPARQFSDAIADAVEKVMPSVVVIHTETVQYKIQPDLFGFPMFRVRQQLAGEGSGVIIDERGYILTSQHVLEGARQIEVVLNTGKKIPAKVVGRDRATDLAVLKIKAEGEAFPAVEFGDSDAVRVGEVAIAIGSPFSLQSSVTVGHVSQKGRRVEILPYEDFIQRGVGIAFSVPSNLAMVIAKSLIEKGVHEWPWVGAFFGETTGQFDGDGVPVEQVWRDTSAAEAGMKPGDMILEVDGIRVKNEHDVYRIIFNHSVGETLRFTVLHDKTKQLEFELLLQEFPRQP